MNEDDFVEIEKQLIGYCFLDKESLKTIICRIKAIDFSSPVLAEYFQTILGVWTEKGFCETTNILQILGREALIDITDYVNKCGLKCELESTIDIVLEQSFKRKVKKLCERVLEELKVGEIKPKELVDYIENVLHQIKLGKEESIVYTLEVMSKEYTKGVEEKLSGGKETKIRTGYSELDVLLGDLRPGQLIYLAARPGVGKTTLALNMFTNMMHQGHRGLFISLEVTRAEIFKKIVSDQLDILFELVRDDKVTIEQAKEIEYFIQKNCIEYVIDQISRNLDNFKIEIKRQKQKLGLSFIMLDYVQLMSDSSKKSKYEEVSNVSTALKQMAKELEIPIISMCQLSRELEKGNNGTSREPKLSDLRDSGSLEADADVVLLMSRKDLQDNHSEPRKVDLFVAKNRFGQTGKITLTSYLEKSRILDKPYNHIDGVREEDLA